MWRLAIAKIGRLERPNGACAPTGRRPKDQAETSVLFELIAARYERRSMLITSNQPFGEWDGFPDQAMTLTAIDRLIHHATILEMNVESYRRKEALDRKRNRGRPRNSLGIVQALSTPAICLARNARERRGRKFAGGVAAKTIELAEDLAVLEREIAESALDDGAVKRLLTITGVNLTVATGKLCIGMLPGPPGAKPKARLLCDSGSVHRASHPSFPAILCLHLITVCNNSQVKTQDKSKSDWIYDGNRTS